MTIKKLLLVVIMFSVLHSTAQKRTEEFELALPETKVTGSLYNSIILVDKRDDTSSLGIVQKGAFNAKAKVVAVTPLSDQLSKLVTALNDSTAKNGELVFLLQALSFAEI